MLALLPGNMTALHPLPDPAGARMARLPVDPMYGKVLLASAEMGCAEEALAVVAMVSSDMVFVTPREKREEAADARKRFVRCVKRPTGMGSTSTTAESGGGPSHTLAARMATT